MKNKKHSNTIKVDIPELTTYLSNGVFKPEVTNKFLDILYSKYRFNRYVRLKIKDTFIKLSITYNHNHLFFSHILTENNDGYSFQYLIKSLKFDKTLCKQKKVKFRNLLLEKTMNSYKQKVVKRTFQGIQEKLAVSNFHYKGICKTYNIVKEFTEELNSIEFRNILEHFAKIKVNQLIKLTDKELKYKDYIIHKNSMLNLMNYQEMPYVETCGKAFDRIKYARNPKKIILINSK